MALDDDIRFLSGVGLFRGLAEEHLRLLAFGAEKLRLGPGETLYEEGEPAMAAYVVVSGRIDLMRTVDGRSDRLTEALPGTVLGELALISPTRRHTAAVSAVETRLLSIERRNFRRILEEYPGVARRLHEQLTEEFQAMVRQLEKVLPPDDDAVDLVPRS